MSNIFSPDSKLTVFLTVLSDLLWINILTLICCIPVFTIGAALTAKDHMCYKLLRGEGSGLTRDYFLSFRRNFRQATFIWLLELAMIMFFLADIYLLWFYGNDTFRNLVYVLSGLMLFAYIISIMIFPMLARFENGIAGTVKNAVIMCASIFPSALLMAVMYLIPPVLGIFFTGLVPFVFLFGLSLPGYLSAMLYRKAFEKVEGAYYAEHPDEMPVTDEGSEPDSQNDET